MLAKAKPVKLQKGAVFPPHPKGWGLHAVDRMNEATNEHEDERHSHKTFAPGSCERASYAHCTFIACTFTETAFTHTRFVACEFQACNLHLAAFKGARLLGARFSECKLTGIEFSACDPLFLKVAFLRCRLLACDFSGLPLKNSLFTDSLLQDCLFRQTNLAGSVFAGCRLPGALFEQADLRGCDFTGAVDYHIDPSANKMENARFSLPEALSLLGCLGIRLS